MSRRNGASGCENKSAISHSNRELWKARNRFNTTSSGSIRVTIPSDNRRIRYHACGYVRPHTRRFWHQISQEAPRRPRYCKDQQTLSWPTRKAYGLGWEACQSCGNSFGFPFIYWLQVQTPASRLVFNQPYTLNDESGFVNLLGCNNNPENVCQYGTCKN